MSDNQEEEDLPHHMQYRTLGNTGIKVSALGFGAMRLPMKGSEIDYDVAVPIIQRAFDLGVNYVDSAHGYGGGTSEVAVGKALKGRPRSSITVSTKAPVRDAEAARTWRARLETQLKRLDTDYIDFYLIHDHKWDHFQSFVAPPGGVLEQARQAQAEGLIRYFSLSCHDTPENMRQFIDTGEFATMTLQYNLLDRHNEPVIAYAREKGVGIVVMGPVAGGKLATRSEVIESMLPVGGAASSAEICFRFVLSNPGVCTAISGMNTLVQVEENVATASREEPLSPAERERIETALDETRKLSDLYCTACGYCLPCKNGIQIPDNFRLMNYFRVYGLRDYARQQYARLAKDSSAAGDCLECGECEPKCPQNLKIVEQLRETAAALRA